MAKLTLTPHTDEDVANDVRCKACNGFVADHGYVVPEREDGEDDAAYDVRLWDAQRTRTFSHIDPNCQGYQPDRTAK